MSERLPQEQFRYSADRASLGAELAARFQELDFDQGAQEFVAHSREMRHGRVLTWTQRLTRLFVSDFDANGWLGMYPMHLASSEQWRTLLGDEPIASLLDVGAGSGAVTRALLPLCRDVLTTETSRPMARRLARSGICCRRVDLALEPLGEERRFDLVACLNVLDRASYPKQLLRRACELLLPQGRLVVALALPYRPFFYDGAATPEPLERLSCSSLSWESAVRELATRELAPLGLEIVTLSRLPYLSFGDAERELYALDDAILVARHAAPG
ncbi:MAG TPA: methyltransferase [Polyangiaceae bacterium]|jgi:SAM-dependent methyltransferase